MSLFRWKDDTSFSTKDKHGCSTTLSLCRSKKGYLQVRAASSYTLNPWGCGNVTIHSPHDRQGMVQEGKRFQGSGGGGNGNNTYNPWPLYPQTSNRHDWTLPQSKEVPLVAWPLAPLWETVILDVCAPPRKILFQIAPSLDSRDSSIESAKARDCLHSEAVLGRQFRSILSTLSPKLQLIEDTLRENLLKQERSLLCPIPPGARFKLPRKCVVRDVATTRVACDTNSGAPAATSYPMPRDALEMLRQRLLSIMCTIVSNVLEAQDVGKLFTIRINKWPYGSIFARVICKYEQE